MKRISALILLIFLAVILQLSVFLGWSLAIFGGPVSPQIFVVLAIFLLFKFDDKYVWYFTFFYYFFYDLITRPAFPGLSAVLVVPALLSLKLLRGKVIRKSVISDLSFFILFSVFYFVLVYHELSFPLVAGQVLVNLMMLLVLYPLLCVVYKLLKPNASSQLSLKV